MVNKMSGESLDLTAQNIARLKELFPEVLTDGEKVDFDMLKTVLGEVVENEQERYQFTWHGKKKMIEGAQKPSKGTLRPIPGKSKNFDTTENLYIEGDNLEVLKLLQKSYNSKIKMIYIDPPYNTGKDFIYDDDYSDNLMNYLEKTGQLSVEGTLLSTNTESNGRFHTQWLNMIYPRLKLAKNLLTDDGVIFISIGNQEMENLKKVCNEIFGKKNHLGTLVWKARVKPVNVGEAKYKPQNEIEYVLVYEKTNVGNKFYPIFTGSVRSYPKDLEGRKYRLATILKSNRGTSFRSTMSFEIDGYKPPEGQRWQAGEAEINRLLKEGYIEFVEGTPFRRYFEDEEGAEHKPLYCFMDSEWTDTSETGKSELNELLGMFHGFDTVKPTTLIKTLVRSCTKDGDIILDFFSGSATTGHAIFELNSIEKSNRKFILVQYPEELGINHKMYGDEFKTIFDLGKERLIKSGEKIKENANDLLSYEHMNDVGFKVYVLDKSNIREWNVDFESLEDELDLYESPFIEGCSELEIVNEIILKQGLELTYPIETFEVDGKTIYDIALGSLFICLTNGITTEIAKAIIKCRDEHGTETSSVIFSDSAFSTDSEKLNCIEVLKDAGYPEDNLLTI